MTSPHFPPRPGSGSAGWFALALLAGTLAAGDSFAAAAKEPLPADLALVPRDAAAFFTPRGRPVEERKPGRPALPGQPCRARSL